MKYILNTLLAILIAQTIIAQNNSQFLNREIQIANIMKDSLNLSTESYNLIKIINEKIALEKSTLFKEQSNREILRARLQDIENKRDQQYKEVLVEAEFRTYQSKKKNIFFSKP